MSRTSINDKWFLFSHSVLIAILSHWNYSTSSLLLGKLTATRRVHWNWLDSNFLFIIAIRYSVFRRQLSINVFFFIVVYCCFVWFYVKCVFLTFFCQISFYQFLFQFTFGSLSVRIRFEFFKTINCLFCYRLSIFQIFYVMYEIFTNLCQFLVVYVISFYVLLFISVFWHQFSKENFCCYCKTLSIFHFDFFICFLFFIIFYRKFIYRHYIIVKF